MNNRVEKAYKLFFDVLISEGIEGILKVAYELFNCPILFTDHNYRLVYQMPNQKTGTPIWDTIFETKQIPVDVIKAYQDNYLTKKIDSFEPYYVNYGIAKDCPQILGDVYSSNRMLGHISIALGDIPLKDDDLHLAKIFIDALNIEITRREKDSTRWKPTSSNYLYDLLDSKTSVQLKQIASDNLKKDIPGSYAIISSALGLNSSDKVSSIFVVNELTRKYRSIASTIFENSIVTLIGEVHQPEFNPLKSRFIDGIIGFLSTQNLISGICDCFDDLTEIQIRYQQAYTTALIATARHNLYLAAYKDYIPLQMFLDIPNINISKNIYLHPVLSKIQKYDTANNTEYFNTLRIYSISMHNKDSAAIQLDIHRNTLLYRLNRIKDLFDLSFENEQTSVHLLCSFLLLEANYLVN